MEIQLFLPSATAILSYSVVIKLLFDAQCCSCILSCIHQQLFPIDSELMKTFFSFAFMLQTRGLFGVRCNTV